MVRIKKVGLALGSGGARGFAHVGVIKVLEENKVPIDFVSGTSIGAVVAAYYALYGNVSGLENVAKTFRKRDFLKLVDFNNPKQSLIKGMKVKDFLRKFFGNKTFADTKIPLTIGATDLKKASQVVINKGRILDALMASGAFPGVFPAFKYKGKYVVDGGVVDATPVDLVFGMGAEVVIAVDLFYLRKFKLEEPSMFKVLERVYEIVMSNLSKYSEKKYGNNIVVLKPETGHRAATFSFHNAKNYIKAGEEEALNKFRKIKILVK